MYRDPLVDLASSQLTVLEGLFSDDNLIAPQTATIVLKNVLTIAFAQSNPKKSLYPYFKELIQPENLAKSHPKLHEYLTQHKLYPPLIQCLGRFKPNFSRQLMLMQQDFWAPTMHDLFSKRKKWDAYFKFMGYLTHFVARSVEYIPVILEGLTTTVALFLKDIALSIDEALYVTLNALTGNQYDWSFFSEEEASVYAGMVVMQMRIEDWQATGNPEFQFTKTNDDFISQHEPQFLLDIGKKIRAQHDVFGLGKISLVAKTLWNSIVGPLPDEGILAKAGSFLYRLLVLAPSSLLFLPVVTLNEGLRYTSTAIQHTPGVLNCVIQYPLLAVLNSPVYAYEWLRSLCKGSDKKGPAEISLPLSAMSNLGGTSTQPEAKLSDSAAPLHRTNPLRSPTKAVRPAPDAHTDITPGMTTS